MRAYQRGDDQAFQALYKRHSGRIYGYLRVKLGGDRAMVDDLFQATFLKFHKTRSLYDRAFPFVPWLFTVCRSVLVDGWRDKKRTIEEADPDAVAKAVASEPIIEGGSLPDLSTLPTEQRRAIELRYGQDLSFEEIAKKLDTSPGNVRQLVSRAIRRLRGLMEVTGRPE